MSTRMYIHKYLSSRMYGFLRDSQGREAFFHLGAFVPTEGETEPIPPLPGEPVDVEIDFDTPTEQGHAPRATQVARVNVPEAKVGKVDKFDTSAGYGFILHEGEMFFLHQSEVRENKVPLLQDDVSFYAGKREGKSRACHVTILPRRR